MEVKLVVDYEAYENGQTMAKSIEELAAKPESAQVTDLIIGDWGGAYESSPEDFIPVLVKLKDQFLRYANCLLVIWNTMSVRFPGLTRRICPHC